ncbi:YDG domain-containing protein [Actomonas aquatica]|uniref:YDG domain-containing protein n=1 Tax=Actomonas aquatica TaxID=2866162 RepID=A0ABZ1CB33_9BACT|nr:YDG domain-containing protein [Opitutus sp. WL0086]WRQ88666.1 YDG domain-containing protein [Opitutus sp. WL0086]
MLGLTATGLDAEQTVVSNYSGASLFVVDLNTGERTELSSATLGTGPNFSSPLGTAKGSDGYLYVASRGTDSIIRVDPATGNRTTVSSSTVGTGPSFNDPWALAIEADGSILVGDQGSGFNLYRVNPTTGDRSYVAQNFASITGLWVEDDGSIIVVNIGNLNSENPIIRVDPATGAQTTVTTLAPYLNRPTALVVRPNGHYLVTNERGNNLVDVDPATGTQTLVSGDSLGTGDSLSSCYALSITNAGDIFVASYGRNTIYSIDPATGDRTAVSSSSVGSGPAFNGLLSIMGAAVTSVVGPSNTAPTDIALSSSSVNQSSGTNATVGTLSTTDADSGDSHTYTLVAGTGDTHNASFNINSDSLRANDASALAAGSYSVRVQTDDGTDTYAESFTITVVDDVAPAAPSTPDLSSVSDSGTSNSDNTTNDTTPTLTGTAEAGTTVTLYDTDGTTALGSGIATGGNWSITTSVLSEGTHTVTAKSSDTAGNTSVASSGLAVTIDTTAPAFTSATTANATYGTSVSFSVTASGSPTAFSTASMPFGLALNSSTGAVTGSPSSAGSSAATITVTDLAGNTAQQTLTIAVARKPVTLIGLGVADKVYDATNAGTFNSTPLVDGSVFGDDVYFDDTSATATFASPNIGSGIAVTVAGFGLSGTDAGNYALSQPTGFTANITAKPLTITGVTAEHKVYDGNNTATLDVSAASLVGAISGDDVNLYPNAATGTFASTSVGTGITVTTADFQLAGTANGNYTLTQPSTSANITARPLTVTGITAQSKEYDATDVATFDFSGAALQNSVSGDNVSLDSSSASGAFANASIGTAKTVTLSGLGLSGTTAGNYTLTTPTGFTANITAKALTITGVTAEHKTYDGNNTATLDVSAASLVGVISGDDVSLYPNAATGSFASTSVGTGITVTTADFQLAGTANGNYTLTQPSTSANITARPLTVTGITAQSKEYDATDVATFDFSGAALQNSVSGDDVSLDSSSAAGAFANASIGTTKTVTLSGLGLSGTAAGNYTLTKPTGFTANITAKALTITGVTAEHKTYDGNNTATLDVSAASLVGAISGDDVSLDTNAATGTFASTSVGTGITVTTADFQLAGTASGNYTLSQPSTSANITAAGITVSGLVANAKVYDASVDATIDYSGIAYTGIIGSDDVSLDQSSVTATFADKTIGTAKPVSLTGSALTGAAAGNYTLTMPSDLSADITAATLTLTGLAVETKAYDGTRTATLDTSAASLNGVQGSDTVSPDYANVTLTFDTATAGVDKHVARTELTLTGADSGNYTLTDPDGLLGAITPVAVVVSAENINRPYGDPNPALVPTYTGLITGEDASVLTGAPVLSTDATRTSAIGDYTITVGLGTLDSTNYTFSAANAQFTIDPGYHFADTDRDYTIGLSELLRMIELYNYREGYRRTGAYQSDDTTTDRYAPGDGERLLPHTADSNGDGQLSLIELTRVIELYNTREGGTRTGAYHYRGTTEDGFAPGPELNR